MGQIQNQFGEINKEVLYHYTSSNLSVQLRKNGFSYELLKQIDASNFKAHRIDIDFVGSDRNCLKTPNEKGSGEWIVRNSYNTVNSIKVNHYKNVYYANVYPHIDIEFLIVSTAGKERFKYNFILHPGANENDIKLLISGAKKQKVLANGSILIETSLGNLEEQVPLSYEQLPNGKMGSKIKAGFKSLGSNLFGLSIANYNKAHIAIIDPMVWSTYFGGAGSDYGNRMVLDKSNNIYIAGLTYSNANIATNGAYQTLFGGTALDGYIAKFNTSGILLWATYYGGSGQDQITTIALDTAQNLVFGGFTSSISAIATPGAYQENKAGLSGTNDGFLGKFSPNGTLLWATYYGGNNSDFIREVIILPTNEIMLTASSNSTDFNFSTFQTHQNTLAGLNDIILAKFSSNGNLIWGTFYGG
ncbi:MAG: SBBP repeat-containing protein, partial [Bacteroidia bacterium]